jgi:hypothetical protein
LAEAAAFFTLRLAALFCFALDMDASFDWPCTFLQKLQLSAVPQKLQQDFSQNCCQR